MNFKELKFGDDARTAMIKGVNLLSNAVKATLGPNGRNVVIKRKFNTPHVTKDGISVAKEIHLRDEFMDMGAQLVLEASSRTNELAGDGTTTSIVLAQEIINQGVKYLEKNVSSTDFKRGMDIAGDLVTDLIKEHAVAVTDSQTMVKVVSVSSNRDASVVDIISKAIEVIGLSGIITVNKGGIKDELEIISGMRISSGWVNQNFVAKSNNLTIELDKPKVVLVDKKLEHESEIIRLLEHLHADGDCAILIAHEFSDAVLSLLATNLKQGVLNVIPVIADGFGTRRTAILEDIAVYTNGVVSDSSNGISITSLSTRMLGSCGKISITRDETAFIDGKGSDESVKERMSEIESLIAIEKNQYNIDKYRERLAALSNGVAVIKVGGYTSAEIQEKKDRADDAICAARACLQEGVLAGGGFALFEFSEIISQSPIRDDLNDDQRIGFDVVVKSLKAPLRQILLNAGLNPEVIVGWRQNIDDKGSDAESVCKVIYNVATGAYETSADNILGLNVLDPAKVTRVALQNAISISGIILSTEVMIGFDGEDKTDNFDAI